MNPEVIIGSGALWLAIPVALLAGLVSFLSPCVLPLVPGYLGFLGGAGAPRRVPNPTDGTELATGGLVVLAALGLLPPLPLMFLWNEPPETMSESIRGGRR